MFGLVDTPVVQPVDAAVDDLVALDVATLDDRTAADALVELRRVQARLAAVEARLVDAVHTRRPWASDGYLSSANWLAATDNSSLDDARRDVRVAHRSARCPPPPPPWPRATSRSLTLGGSRSSTPPTPPPRSWRPSSSSSARHGRCAGPTSPRPWLTGCAKHARTATPTPTRPTETTATSPSTRACGARASSRASSHPSAKPRCPRRSNASNASCSRPTGPPPAPNTARRRPPADLARTPRQRRHDALVEMARRAVTAPANGKRPKPLDQRPGRLRRLPQDVRARRRDRDLPATAASTLDQAAIERVVLDGPSRVLDLGYQRSFTGAARRAIEITQRHCQGRGCHIPGHRCDIDHIWRAADGGPTHPDNGRLLCPAENRARERPPPPAPLPRHRTPEQARAHLELVRQRIRDRLLHDPTWGNAG